MSPAAEHGADAPSAGSRASLAADRDTPAVAPYRRLLVVLDYDGTITSQENMEVVLQRLVGDAWRPFEDAVRRGDYGHAECLRRQVALVTAPRAEFLATLVDTATVRPGFAAFLAALLQGGGRAAVVSAGFRDAIRAVWRREGLPPVDLYASELVGDGPGGEAPFTVAYDPALGDCPRCGPASCKGTVVRALRRPGDVVLVCGDGESDLCAAREADLTFARRRLAELCEQERLPWRPLDYEDALVHLPLLARRADGDEA